MSSSNRHLSRGIWLGTTMGLLILAGVTAAWSQQQERLEITAEEAARRPDQVVARVIGRVYEVSRDGRTFSVEAGDVNFRVEPGYAIRFPTLREGDRVLVVGTLRTQTRLTASEVRVISGQNARALTGELREIDRQRSRLMVLSERGERMEIQYTVDTIIARLGRRVNVDQLRAGDEVVADGRWVSPRLMRATRIEVTGAGDRWQSGQSGEVVSVIRRDRSMRVDFGEETRTVLVPPEATISRDGRPVPFDQLVPGDQIRVSGGLRDDAVSARSIELLERAGNARTVEGRVGGIDSRERLLRINVNALIPVTVRVYVPADTQISRGTSRLTLADIREGDRIRARGPTRDGRVVADTLEVLP
jgi:hypothetical protein